MKIYVGIDIAKDSFVCAIPQDENYKKFNTIKFSNNKSGLTQLLAQLPVNAHCILEATGNYSLLLTYFLIEQKMALSVINPKFFKHFFKLLGQTQKNDPQDARILSLYGRRMQPKVFKPQGKSLLIIKQKRALLAQLKKQLTAFKNFISALEVHPFKDEQSLLTVQQTVKYLEKQSLQIQEQITKISKEDFKKQFELLVSIPAIGERMANELILATNGFEAFLNAKQFAKYIGIAPTYYQSGTSLKKKGRINRSGDPSLRAMLYVCSWSAIRHNPSCAALYQRLKEKKKKPSMVALIAVMNKLVKIAFGVIKSGKKFDAKLFEKLSKGKAA